MNATQYLAIDLGAESGRIILGTLDQERLHLEEISRFPTKTITRDNHLYWDLPALTNSVFEGLENASQTGRAIAGISADSWALDYVLLNENGESIGLPFCYRDSRTGKSMERLFNKISWQEVYAETGIQLMPINTLVQFDAETQDSFSPRRKATHFLLLADYFNYLFSGVEAVDESMASTTQIYNPIVKQWSEKLVSTLGLSADFFPRIVPSGTVLGNVKRELSFLSQAQVVTTCSHDTGAAVAAVPADSSENWAYISSGTWSLLGVELDQPILSDAAREASFTNEIGLGGTTRFLKNIVGLWVVQECSRSWEAEGQVFTYEQLTRLAGEHGPAVSHLELDDPRFLSPGKMLEKVTRFCQETGQPVPPSPGAIVRTILESLALSYAQVLRCMEEIIGKKIDKIHIVGGGSRNHLLNQLTADATGLPVAAGPVEATAIGNILIQALALGHIQSAQHLREVVEASFPVTLFSPRKSFTPEVLTRFQNLKPAPRQSL